MISQATGGNLNKFIISIAYEEKMFHLLKKLGFTALCGYYYSKLSISGFRMLDERKAIKRHHIGIVFFTIYWQFID